MNANHPAVAAPRRITKLEAATRLGCNQRAINRLIAMGQIRAVTVPGLRQAVLAASVDVLVEKMIQQAEQANQAG